MGVLGSLGGLQSPVVPVLSWAYTLKDLRSRLRAVYIFIQNDVLAYAPLLFSQQPVCNRGSRLRAVYIFI